ncbi:MAG: PqqD family protein [Acidobacteriota bacterium]
MINSLIPTARKEGLVIQEMPDEILVYDLETNQAHCLNQTAASVWKNCDGVNSVTDIKLKLEKEFNSVIPEDFVWLAIDQLSKDKLLEKEIETKISGLSRREVIKRIGFASMAALPVVAMLSFPQNALAVGCPVSICSEAPGSGGCGADHCCRGTCSAAGVPCSPACGTTP